MKKKYSELEIEICTIEDADIVRTSYEVEGDETKYPIPDTWGQ